MRSLLGLLLGLCLAGLGLGFIGAGHGTVAPLAFSSSVLAMMLDLGPIIPLVGTPLLWGLYFLLIPDLDSRTVRMATAAGVVTLHLIMGLWFSYDDAAGMQRAYDMQFGGLIVFFLLLAISSGLLIFLSARHRTT